jgi:Type I phosphodiesterase / nucleotide pyrophosphatase
MRQLALVGTLCCSLMTIESRMKAEDDQGNDEKGKIRHVLVISLDGTHSLDIANYIAANPHSTLAQLSAGGVNFTNAHTTKPSDSIPATAAIFTGGTPAVTGMYYDDAYNRKLSPAGSACATVGVIIDLKEGIDLNPAALDGGGGIDPAKVPLDPSKGCTPVFPHNLIRVNTVFEVAKSEGLHTAYSEKRPSYDFLNGPSGKGIDDLYTPEIAFNNPTANATLKDIAKTEAFDELRVVSILNEIDGKDHTGTKGADVPAIFGMNFQAVNSVKKSVVAYSDSFSTPTAGLTGALNYIDGALGRMIAELKAKGLDRSTAIIVTAKHGETALDETHRTVILTSVIPGIVNSVNPTLLSKKPVTQKSNAFIWLSDQSQTKTVVQALTTPTNQALAGIDQVLSGESLKLVFPDPLTDPAVPDIIVVAKTGVNYEPTATSTTLAEHGGLGENDTHVPLIVFTPGRTAAVSVQAPVLTTQIAPTVLSLLKLDPNALQAVRAEATQILPFISTKEDN